MQKKLNENLNSPKFISKEYLVIHIIYCNTKKTRDSHSFGGTFCGDGIFPSDNSIPVSKLQGVIRWKHANDPLLIEYY